MVVTASMINAALYCERLLYLRWADGHAPQNYFVADGRAVHARVDGELGDALPAAKDVGDQDYVARSVEVASDRSGITAKVDVVEIEDGRVDVIEYKRGIAPDLPEGAYLPERAQVCAEVIALRDSGYDVREASIYFVGSRRRIPIAIDDSLVATTLRAATRAAEIVAGDTPPLPLVDSPKCSGCSLAGICLPDEVNALSRKGAVVREPRQLRVEHEEGAPLHVQEQGARVGLRDECLIVRGRDGEETDARLAQISEVSVYGSVQVSTQALRELMRREVPVSFFTTGNWYCGRAIGHDSGGVRLRAAQYRRFADEAVCLDLARGLVASKIKNCRTMIRRNGDSEVAVRALGTAVIDASRAPSLESLLGIEGAAAAVYFGAFSTMLKADSGFDFEKRNRRPPRDPINALLSLAYALLVRNVTLTTVRVGLDPGLGFYHQIRSDRPALALDLMEEFRPIVADSVVVSAINGGVITSDDFMLSAEAVALTGTGRKKFITAFERRLDQEIEHPVFKYKANYHRVFEIQVRLLGRYLTGEIDAFSPFNTR